MHQLLALSSPRVIAAGRPYRHRAGRAGRLPLVVFGVALALTLGLLLLVMGSATPWLLLAAAPLYATYVTAATLVALGVYARLRGRPLRPVPFLSRLWRPATSYRVLLLFLVLTITLLRGGLP